MIDGGSSLYLFFFFLCTITRSTNRDLRLMIMMVARRKIRFKGSNDEDDQRRPPSDTRPSFFGSQEKSSWSGDESSKVQPKACVLRQDYLLDWPHVMMSVNWLSVCRCRTLLELEQIKSHVFSFCLSACLVPSGGVCVCQNMYSKQVAAGASLLLYETFFVERGVVW